MYLNRHRLDLWTRTVASFMSPQAAAFLARTSGLNIAHRNAYIALIDGLVADGIWATLDILYMFATADTTTANLNLINTNFTCTLTNAPTFTTDRGYTGNGSTSFINTNYDPSINGTNFIVTSGQFSVWDMTSRSGDDTIIMGNNDSATFTDVLVFRAGNFILTRVSAIGANNLQVTNSGSQGFITASRTSLVDVENLKNGISLGTGSEASSALTAGKLYCLARNDNGTAGEFTTDQIGVAAAGGGLTTAQVLLFYNRIHTYMQTIAGVA